MSHDPRVNEVIEPREDRAANETVKERPDTADEAANHREVVATIDVTEPSGISARSSSAMIHQVRIGSPSPHTIPHANPKLFISIFIAISHVMVAQVTCRRIGWLNDARVSEAGDIGHVSH